MPTVRGIPGGYRFFFYSFDCNEPMHVHIKREAKVCKFWLQPLALAGNDGYSAHELGQIRRAVMDNLELLIGAWNEHCCD